MANSSLKILTLTGSAIEPYIRAIARLRVEVFREHPYLMATNFEHEIHTLEKYPLSVDSIAVVIFDGSLLVGASLGIPFELENKEFQRPFVAQKIPIEECFYFGRSVLLKSYRGRGIGHHFFDLREEKAKALKRFKYVCFWDVQRSEPTSRASVDSLALTSFWSKRGYINPPDLNFNFKWKDLETNEMREKKLAYWIKTLT